MFTDFIQNNKHLCYLREYIVLFRTFVNLEDKNLVVFLFNITKTTIRIVINEYVCRERVARAQNHARRIVRKILSHKQIN